MRDAGLNPVTDGLIEAIVQTIVQDADPDQIILFGSRARGDDHPDSDLDLIVIEAKPFEGERNRMEEMARLSKAIANFLVPADILVYSQDDVEYWRDSLNHVLARALREGRILYERREVRAHSR